MDTTVINKNTTTMKTISLKSWLTDIIVMAKRELLKVKHSPEKLFDVTVMPIIMVIVFSQLFSGAIMGNVKAYLPLVVPGILIQTLVMASGAAGTQLREDLDKGATDRFNSLPISRIAPLAGTLISDIIRYIIAAVFALGTGAALGWRASAGFGWLLVAIGRLAIVTTWALSWLFALVGVLAKGAATVTTISSFLTMFLAFLSNAYIPVTSLPKWLKVIAENNPVSHLITAFKEVAYNGNFGHEAWLVLLISLLIVLILAPVTVLTYSKKN